MKKKFDKYDIYTRAVQSPQADMEFLRDVYQELKKRKAKTLREDFCGTFANSCEWVKMQSSHVAYGLDLDPEPIGYGKRHYLTKLKPEQQARVHISEGNVLKPRVPKVDIVSAFNFSFNIFKSRDLLRTYFSQALRGLNKNGVFVVDCFGGSDAQLSNVERRKLKKFTYYWDQASFDPVTHFAKFHIHFHIKGERKRRRRVFSYDWRLWSIPEIKEMMLEVGFRKAHVYWEGTTRKGGGDGKFKRVEKGEECRGWIAYVVGEK